MGGVRLKYIELYCTAVPVNVSICCFFQLFLLKKNPLHLQINVLYAFKKKYRVSSLCGFTACVLRACVFQIVVPKRERENVRTVGQFPSQSLDLPLFITPLLCARCEQIVRLI